MEQVTSNKVTETKLIKLLKSRGLKVFLFVLIFGLSLFGYSASQDKKEQPPEESAGAPTPTLPYIERQQKKLEMIKKLPYTEDRFSIQYFPANDKFIVSIKKNPYLQNQAAAKSWFLANEVNPENVEITWTSVRGVF